MDIWDFPVLTAVALLGGMKVIYGIGIWKEQAVSLSGIWTDRYLYLASGISLLLYGGGWLWSGREMLTVRCLDLLYTYGILAVVDGKKRIVPDEILLCFLAGQMLLGARCMALGEFIHVFTTGAVLLALLLAFAYFSRGKVGMGDARLLGVTALTAGWNYTLQLLAMAMALSFFYSICLIVFFRKSVRTEFPFVPFLATAMAVQMLFVYG